MMFFLLHWGDENSLDLFTYDKDIAIGKAIRILDGSTHQEKKNMLHACTVCMLALF